MRLATKNLYHAGIAALFIIVVVGAAALLMAVGAAMLGIGELTMGFTEAKGEEALALADGCLEYMLEYVRDMPYLTINIINGWAARPPDPPLYQNGSCYFLVARLNSSSVFNLTVTAAVGDYHKKIIGTIQKTSEGVQLTSWQEASN